MHHLKTVNKLQNIDVAEVNNEQFSLTRFYPQTAIKFPDISRFSITLTHTN